jgi:hypothetical protein
VASQTIKIHSCIYWPKQFLSLCYMISVHTECKGCNVQRIDHLPLRSVAAVPEGPTAVANFCNWCPFASGKFKRNLSSVIPRI